MNAKNKNNTQQIDLNLPPDKLPVYRVITGPDDAEFCHRVSEELSLGYKLYGNPSVTFNKENVIVAQAIIWPSVKIFEYK